MDTAVMFAIMGLLVNRLVDFLRNAFDKSDKLPKAWWLVIAWALGIGLAFIVCGTTLADTFGVKGANCTTQVLAGFGFGSIAGFWHEILSALSGAPAATPKGMLPRNDS